MPKRIYPRRNITGGRAGSKRFNALPGRTRTKYCRLCHERIEYFDYKDVAILQRLCTGQAKMVSRKRSGVCTRHQRMAQRAIRQARIMALLPFVG